MTVFYVDGLSEPSHRNSLEVAIPHLRLLHKIPLYSRSLYYSRRNRVNGDAERRKLYRHLPGKCIYAALGCAVVSYHSKAGLSSA